MVLLVSVSHADVLDRSAQDSCLTLFDSLNALEIDHVILTTDLDSLLSNKFSRKEHHGLLTVTLKDDRQLSFSTKVSVRGKFRRIQCDFPPVRLNFRKKDLRAMGLNGKRDNYKLVTHCLADDDGINAVLREYLVYQMYQVLTDHSFRVKLFPIIYKDVDSKHQVSSMSFLIESTKELTQRCGGSESKDLNPEHSTIDPLLFEQVALFQYMVGNRDMNLQILRNIVLVSRRESEKMIPVAYDFDMSPFVQAAYTYPQYKDKRDVDRIYLGVEDNAHHLTDLIEKFQQKKEEFYQLVESFELLPTAARRECINYLKAFYRLIEDENFEVVYQDD